MALSRSDLIRLLESLRSTDGIELIRAIAERMVQELIEAEASAHVGATWNERTPTWTGVRTECSWDFDTHMITEAVPVLRFLCPNRDAHPYSATTPANQAIFDLARAPGFTPLACGPRDEETHTQQPFPRAESAIHALSEGGGLMVGPEMNRRAMIDSSLSSVSAAICPDVGTPRPMPPSPGSWPLSTAMPWTPRSAPTRPDTKSLKLISHR